MIETPEVPLATFSVTGREEDRRETVWSSVAYSDSSSSSVPARIDLFGFGRLPSETEAGVSSPLASDSVPSSALRRFFLPVTIEST